MVYQVWVKLRVCSRSLFHITTRGKRVSLSKHAMLSKRGLRAHFLSEELFKKSFQDQLIASSPCQNVGLMCLCTNISKGQLLFFDSFETCLWSNRPWKWRWKDGGGGFKLFNLRYVVISRGCWWNLINPLSLHHEVNGFTEFKDFTALTDFGSGFSSDSLHAIKEHTSRRTPWRCGFKKMCKHLKICILPGFTNQVGYDYALMKMQNTCTCD